jgi:hypothetical protein
VENGWEERTPVTSFVKIEAKSQGQMSQENTPPTSQ